MVSRNLLIGILGSGLSLWATSSAIAQSITPAADSTGTQITVDGDRTDIHGGTLSSDGANLFHSFEEFGLTSSQIANFLSQPGIENILGRVVGGNPSVINGLLQVTGGNSNLYLMNPSGIVFGSQAQLNVPGDFVATTATGIGFESGEWFNAVGSNNHAALVGTPNQFAFDGVTAGAIANAGNLSVNPGQDITLLAGETLNTGEISAPQGTVTIAAVPGENLVRLSQEGHLLSLEFAAPRNATGELKAIAPIDLPKLLTGSGVSTKASVTSDNIQIDGTSIPIPSTTEMNLVSGGITASEVNVLGDRVGLFGAKIDASGKTGGGDVRIGGEYRGEGNLPNATFTYVDKDSVIQANALESGNGGRVIVWSDDTTRFFGNISAQGVEDGGFVEVSGKKSLLFPDLTTVNVAGKNGQSGTLLLDPENIVIVASGGTNNTELSADNQVFASDGGGTFTIDHATLNTALLGGNVILEASNNITFDADYAYAGAPVFLNQLELSAGNNITAQALDFTGGGSFITVFMDAGNDISIGELRADTVSLIANNTVTTGNIDADFFIDVLANRNILINGFIDSAGGEISLDSFGTIQVTGTNAGRSLSTGGGQINIFHGGGLINLPFTVGDASINGTAGSISTGTFTISPQQSFSGNFTLGNKITIQTDGTYNPCTVTNCSPLNNLDSLDLGVLDESLVLIDDDIGEIVRAWETSLSQQYIDYYDLADQFNNQEATATLDEIKDYLRTIEDRVGVKPAIAYLVLGTTEVGESETVSSSRSTLNRFEAKVSSSLSSGNKLDLSDIKVSSSRPQPWWIFNPDKSAMSEMPAEPLAQGSPSDRLEIILVVPGEQPIRYPVAAATRSELRSLIRRLQRAISNPRSSRYLDPSQQLYNHLITPIQSDLERLEIDHIAFVPDSGLRSLPFAALHDGDRFLIEDYSVNLMPSVALTDLRYSNLQTLPVLAMGASIFENQTPLPSVPQELSIISNDLREGEIFLNEAFTVDNLQQARRDQPFPIVHLATHGEFQSGKPDQSYIQLGRDRLPLDQIRELELYDPLTELLVLSACRTALGDYDAELGFAGLAVASGAKTALGSLWYVSDQGTLALMASFYEQLAQTTTRSEALRQAQLALLQGQTQITDGGTLQTRGGAFSLDANPLNNAPNLDLSHPYYWSAFTMIGSPW